MASRTRVAFVAGLLALCVGWVAAVAQQRGAPPPTTGTAFLAGQVVEATTGQPIAGVTVTLTGSMAGRAGGPQPPVVVDSQGRFFFANLPGGTYRTQTMKPGYTSVSPSPFDRAIELADGERLTTVKVRLLRLGSIAGVVRDDGGDPGVGVDVMAFVRGVFNGRASLGRYAQTKTDDRGAYRLAGLRPGDYFVCACGQDPMPFDGLLLTTLAADPIQLMGAAARALRIGSDAVTLDSTLGTLAPTFHPNSATFARATRVIVASGEDKSAIDIAARIVRAARVSGTIVGAPNPITAQSVRLIPADEIGDVTPTWLSPVLVQPDGRFDFAGVPPGQYVLRVQHTITSARGGAPSGSALQLLGARGAAMGILNTGIPNVNDPVLWASQTLTVGEDGAAGLIVPLRRGIPVAGRVQFVGTVAPPPPQALARMSVLVQLLNPGIGSVQNISLGALSPDATFRVAGVVPGRYFIGGIMANAPGWSTLKSVAIGGVDVTGIGFEIGESDITDVVVTISDAFPTMVTGMLAGGQQDGSDVSVVAFPIDRRFWTEPVAAGLRFRAGAVNAKGVFRLQNLPAGDYFLAVLPDEALLNWQSAERLDALARTAQRVALTDGQVLTITIH